MNAAGNAGVWVKGGGVGGGWGRGRKGAKRSTGGERKKAPPQPPLEPKNQCIVLTGVRAEDARPTRDPYDRAHGVRDAIGDGLMPNARRDGRGKVTPLIGSSPRRYHPSQLVCREYESVEVLDADGNVVGWKIRRDARGHQVVTAGLAFDSQFDSLSRVQAELDGIPGIGLRSGGNINLAERQARALGAMHAVGRSPNQRCRGGEW